MRPINVHTEIMPLKKVVVHRPGDELRYLTPNTLTELLFDDIPDLKKAQEEHDQFVSILRGEGAEVVYLEDLMAETLKANEGLKADFLEEYLDNAGIYTKAYREALLEYFNNIKDEKEFVVKTMAGVPFHEVGDIKTNTLVSMVDRPYMLLNPMPNLYFTRDPFATIGNNVSVNTMYAVTRNRETIYGDYIFKYHPEYKGQVQNLFGRHENFHTEGGDIFNVNEETLFIGISQRTQAGAIDILAHNVFFGDVDNKIKKILAFTIPESHAFMHLDTVFTMIDHDAFTYHPEILQTLQVFELTAGENETVHIEEHHGELDEILANVLGIDKVRLYPCGGGDSMAAEREQWNDGSNTLTIAPGKVLVYERNDVTNDSLEKAGFEVIKLDASNLTVGRGGPRCMSMPLVRED